MTQRVLAALRRFASRLALGLLLAAPAMAAPTLAADAPPLVGVDWLKDHVRDQGVVVLDIRSAIDGGGAAAYEAAHIPGSVHSDYDKAGWRRERDGVAFQLPTVPELEKLIGDLGIDEETRVVVVPAGVGYNDFGAAARAYWTLKITGVKQVSILDGGVAAWKAAGLPLDSGRASPSPAIFTATLDTSLIAHLPDVQKAQASGGTTLVDARPVAFYRGKEKAPNVAAYGHIPGALELDSSVFYDAQTNRLKPKARLAALADKVPAGPTISYCNTGHWAATDWFVLHELLGRKDVRLYDGSMVEWAADAGRPIESDRTKWDDLKRALGLGS